ncbi:hypothetical protein GDO86_009421 [Hymenochirus boettgeri]|uniref:Sulfotransferase n=1 Tax=Hymenochirus boettgeri TaxID=247094 RepID=A0A8T2JFY7_9PIPI|nr:hypothetical protein GDO86_009421 [Hymenochirus boettgeri]
MANRKQLLKEFQNVIDFSKDIPEEKKLIAYNGVLYPGIVCSPETFRAMEFFEARSDDMMLVSYPKCGHYWTLQLLNDIAYAVYNKEPPSIMQMLEFGSPDKFEKMKDELSPRVFGTHLYYDTIPKSVFAKNVKILVVIRNPKDTAVSYYHFHNNHPGLPTYSSWDTFFQDFISGQVAYGSYFNHAVTWNKHIDDTGVMVMTFEKMKEDLKTAVKDISSFFELSLTEEQVQHVVDKGTFKSMNEKSKETYGEFGKAIFRKGNVGDWKNYFSEDQSHIVDDNFEKFLAGTKLGELMKYNVYCKA